MQSTREQIILGLQCGCSHSGEDRLSGRLRDFELHWTLGFLLHNDCACGDSIAVGHITDAQLHEIAAAKFAVDRQIEQRQLALAIGHLQTNANRPDIAKLKRCLLPDQLALVSGFTTT